MVKRHRFLDHLERRGVVRLRAPLKVQDRGSARLRELHRHIGDGLSAVGLASRAPDAVIGSGVPVVTESLEFVKREGLSISGGVREQRLDLASRTSELFPIFWLKASDSGSI